jgi:hypothetical protein
VFKGSGFGLVGGSDGGGRAASHYDPAPSVSFNFLPTEHHVYSQGEKMIIKTDTNRRIQLNIVEDKQWKGKALD